MKTVLKIPYDGSIVESHRRGTSKGPDALQNEINEKNLNWRDIKIDEGDFSKTLEIIRKTAKEEYDKGNFVIGLGGDHSVSYGLVKAFLEKHPKGGLVVFDAHFDCMDNFYPPTHEDWLRVLIEREPIGKRIFIIGPRNVEKTEMYFIYERASWAKSDFFKSPDAPNNLIEGLRHFIDLNKLEELYVSVDIDVVDSEFAPGTGWPEKEGATPDQMKKLLEFLKSTNKVKGMDIVEVSPPKDIGNITNKLAASLLSVFF